MRGLFLIVASATALSPTTRRAWTQGLAAGTATIATAAAAEGPPGGFKAKPVEQPTSKVNINTSQAPAYMDCPGMRGAAWHRPSTRRRDHFRQRRYPTIASRIVEHVRYEGRFKKVSDLYEAEDIIQGNDNIKAAIKRNEARLVVN